VSDVLALVALSGLITWRLASLLHTEDAFAWLRERIGIGHDEKGFPIIYPETFWGNTFKCFWCLSLIVALPISTACIFMSDVSGIWLTTVWFASGTVAIWTEKQIMRAQSR